MVWRLRKAGWASALTRFDTVLLLRSWHALPKFRLLRVACSPLDRLSQDGGGLTLLMQDDVGGLQVQKWDGTWIDAVPKPYHIVVNVGQQM